MSLYNACCTGLISHQYVFRYAVPWSSKIVMGSKSHHTMLLAFGEISIITTGVKYRTLTGFHRKLKVLTGKLWQRTIRNVLLYDAVMDKLSKYSALFLLEFQRLYNLLFFFFEGSGLQKAVYPFTTSRWMPLKHWCHISGFFGSIVTVACSFFTIYKIILIFSDDQRKILLFWALCFVSESFYKKLICGARSKLSSSFWGGWRFVKGIDTSVECWTTDISRRPVFCLLAPVHLNFWISQWALNLAMVHNAFLHFCRYANKL